MLTCKLLNLSDTGFIVSFKFIIVVFYTAQAIVRLKQLNELLSQKRACAFVVCYYLQATYTMASLEFSSLVNWNTTIFTQFDTSFCSALQ